MLPQTHAVAMATATMRYASLLPSHSNLRCMYARPQVYGKPLPTISVCLQPRLARMALGSCRLDMPFLTGALGSSHSANVV
jgi:hypothetical protein